MEKWGKWLIPFFFAMVPWDISKVLFPPYLSTPESPTTLTFVRIAAILLIAWGTGLIIQRRSLGIIYTLFRSKLNWGVLILLIAAVVSLTASQQMHVTLVEGVRLIVFIALGMSIAFGGIVSSNLELELIMKRVWQTIFVMATLLAIFGIVQYLTGWGIWGGAIAPGPRRVNAVFMDANIFARFLDISILGTCLLLIKKQWKMSPGILLGLICQGAALIFTYSRMAWLILCGGILVLIIVSASRNRWRYLAGFGAGSMALGFIPAVQSRIIPLLTGQDPSLGTRFYLIEGGWAMFVEHPLTGVGLGNFQWAIEHTYNYVLPYIGVVSRSHTSLVTVAAEMGILGILAMFIFLTTLLWQNLNAAGNIRNYLLAANAGVIVIWLSSQGEGRFFEDPLLWAFWGLSLAVVKQGQVGWLINLLKVRRN
ncbi:MAG: O-antigen ligase family protein [Desulfosporosinus sp.]